MNRLAKTALMASVAFGVITTTAHAQDGVVQDPAAGDTVDDIIVTARRTEESLQTTPLAVSAFSGASLEARGAQQITDLQGAVPNMNLVQGRGSSNSTNIYIRGVGQPDALQTFDPAVGVYVDDVYYSRIRGTQFDLLDLERVEVLRGPQGTLYGKNTIGGALKLVTRLPGDEFRARGSVSAGNYDMRELMASVSGPVVDGFAMGVSALHSERGGYVTDPVTGAEYNDKNTDALRLALAFSPEDNWSADLSFDWARDDAGLTVGQATNDLTYLGGYAVVRPIPQPLAEYEYETRATPGLPNSTYMTHKGVTGRINWDITDAWTFRSITGVRALDSRDFIDFDATELEIADALVDVDQTQISQEFQLNYESGAWTGVGGVYYLREDVQSYQESYNDELLGPAYLNSGFLRTIEDDLATESKAAYANVSYDFGAGLRVSGGLRYTEEEKDYWRTTTAFFSLLPAFNNTYVFAPPKGSWDDVSGALSVDYQVNDDILVYGRVSQGFKSGGFNGRANSVTEATAYDPETATTFELGAKTSWMDNRLRANLAVFQNTYEDFQARVSATEIDLNTGLPTGVLSVVNAGELDIMGAELELVAAPIDNLLLDAQIGWLDAEYAEFDDARFTNFGGSRAFQDPAFSPEWTARFAGQYAVQLGGGADLTLGAGARYRSEMALAIDNTATNSDVKLPGMYQDAYWLYDARVVWNEGSGRFSLGLYGQNLADEVYKTDAQEFSSIGNIRTAYYGAPRTWMVKLTARY